MLKVALQSKVPVQNTSAKYNVLHKRKDESDALRSDFVADEESTGETFVGTANLSRSYVVAVVPAMP